MNDIQKVEYNGTLVLTTQQIADAYETDTKTLSNNFNRNKDRYINGKHYIYLDGEELKRFKGIHQNDESLLYVSKLYLWTKKGAFLHAKSLNTDKAWEVYDRLVDNYFDKNQYAVNFEELDPQTGLMNLLVQSISKQELEHKKQAEKITKLEDTIKQIGAKVTTHNEDYYTIVGCRRNILQVANKEPFNSKGNIRKQAGGYVWRFEKDD